MRRIEISHVTEYLFPSRVSLLPHRLLLRPRENHNVRIESSVLEISPASGLPSFYGTNFTEPQEYP